MNPENTDAPSHLTLVRQQLILAQVRIMELEDVRDELTPGLHEARRLLHQAQLLVDQKADALAHAKSQHASLEIAHRELIHVQHVTNEALNTARSEHAVAQSFLASLREELAQLQIAQHDLRQALQNISSSLAESQTQLAQRDERIVQLDRELRLMKTSRSWRWTKMLRSIERWFKGRPPS